MRLSILRCKIMTCRVQVRLCWRALCILVLTQNQYCLHLKKQLHLLHAVLVPSSPGVFDVNAAGVHAGQAVRPQLAGLVLQQFRAGDLVLLSASLEMWRRGLGLYDPSHSDDDCPGYCEGPAPTLPRCSHRLLSRRTFGSPGPLDHLQNG